VVYCWLP